MQRNSGKWDISYATLSPITRSAAVEYSVARRHVNCIDVDVGPYIVVSEELEEKETCVIVGGMGVESP